MKILNLAGSLSVACCVFLSVGNTGAILADEPKISSVTYAFDTTSDDKDWNTQEGSEIICDGHDIANRFAFSSDRKADHWSDHTSQGPWPLPLSDTTVNKSHLTTCIYRVTTTAHGNDKWNFNAHLSATFSDGSTWTWVWTAQSLNSRGYNPTHVDLPMGNPQPG